MLDSLASPGHRVGQGYGGPRRRLQPVPLLYVVATKSRQSQDKKSSMQPTSTSKALFFVCLLLQLAASKHNDLERVGTYSNQTSRPGKFRYKHEYHVMFFCSVGTQYRDTASISKCGDGASARSISTTQVPSTAVQYRGKLVCISHVSSGNARVLARNIKTRHAKKKKTYTANACCTTPAPR